MKTFREFAIICEDRMAERLSKMSDSEFEQFLKGRTPSEEASFRARRTRVSGQNVRSGSQTRTQTPPRQSSGTSTQTPPRQSSGTSTQTRTSPSGRFKRDLYRAGLISVADPIADVGISQIRDRNVRSNVQTAKDAAVFAATPVLSGTLGISGSSAPSGSRDVGAYRIRRRIDTSEPGSGFDRFLATGRDKKGFTYNDPAEKIMGYRRDRVGSKNPEDKPVRIGAARLDGRILPARWGSVAGEKKVGTPEQQASTRGVQQSREVAARSGTYGASKGSALTGIGGQTTTSKDTKGNAFMSTGAGSQRKTVQLAKTQLVRDPKTGKQVVGDLAFKGGQATYLARPSIASRDGNLLSRLSRATGIGGQRERDVAAAKQEYRTALKNTQTYQKQLGIKPQSATAQRLPGQGVGPKKVGPKIVGPKIVGPKKPTTSTPGSTLVKPV